MVEFITPKEEFSNEEGQGRLSGSMAWRQLRGETKEGNVVLNVSYTVVVVVVVVYQGTECCYCCFCFCCYLSNYAILSPCLLF